MFANILKYKIDKPMLGLCFTLISERVCYANIDNSDEPVQTHSLTKAVAARTHLGSIVMSQLTKRKAVHVDGGSDKNKSKQRRIQDFWKIDLSRGDPGFLEGGSAL